MPYDFKKLITDADVSHTTLRLSDNERQLLAATITCINGAPVKIELASFIPTSHIEMGAELDEFTKSLEEFGSLVRSTFTEMLRKYQNEHPG